MRDLWWPCSWYEVCILNESEELASRAAVEAIPIPVHGLMRRRAGSTTVHPAQPLAGWAVLSCTGRRQIEELAFFGLRPLWLGMARSEK